MRKRILFCISLLLTVAYFAQAAEIRIKPNRLNPNGNRARIKAEILQVDGKSVELSGITLNGISPLRTQASAKKVIAFFPKNEVVATLGEVSKGDVVLLTMSFSEGTSAPTVLTDEVRIVGKKK